MTSPILTTKRLTLRPFAAADFPAYAAYRANPERNRFTGGAVDTGQAFGKFAAMIGHWTLRDFGRYAIDLDGAAIGHAGPFQNPDDVAEMSWTLWSAEHEGQGYATEAAQRIVAHLMGELGWAGLIARVEPDNEASHAVARRLGAIIDKDAKAPDWFPNAVTWRFQSEAYA